MKENQGHNNHSFILSYPIMSVCIETLIELDIRILKEVTENCLLVQITDFHSD